MSKYAEIIERLEKATGPSEEIGVRVKCAVLAPDTATVEQSKFNGKWCIFDGEYKGQPRLWQYPKVPNEMRLADPTASTDAALWLAERTLPGQPMIMGIGQTELTRPWARIGSWSGCDAVGSTLPIAILLALFRTIEAKEAG